MTMKDNSAKDNSSVEETENHKIFSYDVFPYQNHTFSYIAPEHMESIGFIFGTNPVNVKTARVLELGCGVGLTSIAFGTRHPDAKVIGIDMSKVQIDEGKKYVENLKLKNVELKAMSIMDIDKSFGEFDYIICHGVFAWVPSEVQSKILEVIQNHLSPTGLAHVSYNALPGWNVIQTFRDMMQYHAEMFKSEEERLTQACAFIKFMDEALSESNTPYSQFLKQELQVVGMQEASYIKHEYLDKGNSQFYFTDFAAKAAEYGLIYLGDSALSTMHIGNLPKDVFEKLKVVNNIVAVEQYMDFITNRRFRNTLLCKANVQINRNVTPTIFDKLYIAAQIVPVVPEKQVNFDNATEALSFTVESGGINFTTASSLSKAICYSLAKHIGKFLSIDELTTSITELLPKTNVAELKPAIQASLVEMLFRGVLEVRLTPPISIDTISTNPTTSSLARYEIEHKATLITNAYSHSINLNIVQKLIVLYSNGQNTVEQINNNILTHIAKGELNINHNEQVVTDSTKQKELVASIVNETLKLLKNWYFLIG